MKKSDKFNGSGCLDMTAFMALKNIERERAKKSRHIRKSKKKNSVGCKIQILKSRVDIRENFPRGKFSGVGLISLV